MFLCDLLAVLQRYLFLIRSLRIRVEINVNLLAWKYPIIWLFKELIESVEFYFLVMKVPTQSVYFELNDWYFLTMYSIIFWSMYCIRWGRFFVERWWDIRLKERKEELNKNDFSDNNSDTKNNKIKYQ